VTESTVDRSAVEAARARFHARLADADTDQKLKALSDEFLSRKSGLVTGLMKMLGTLAADTRREFGALVNALKSDIESAIEDRRAALETTRRPAGAVDVTLPGRALPVGRVHPLMRVRQQIEDIFTRMGYEILEGPEVEDDYHNFEALNMPPDHPARDMQDTLYLASSVRSLAATPASLLRTHTSGMQIRYMEKHQPPVRLIAPGRVYRRDQFDLTHTPMFTQVEGLVVGEGVSLADLKGTLATFAHELFGPERDVRLRPSFFPYTEPSAELDISCAACKGTGRVAAKPGSGSSGEGGCNMCKQTGWIEVLGSGMVHPAVFEAVGYDSDRYTGFAFGMGIERIALLKWGVEDIRLFYENDLRFLEQFRP
jgi:phenylalanyl-tRNA synthetase alpha chain